ncbi:acetate kinase [Brevibacillus sp. 7WMA2]|uniref:Acetate kinase n=1 Tax=Brevibacillus laterosporus LMG 15441 TaxID=1042163 RepID=A0A075R198_BRELA|nr:MULTISPECIES: acetate kinase [Brevibacillus]HAS01986.1 acetate kinase [Brevibacillus sp.]AIG24993.1 acetate kinase [Brevibacillus laterosporus LMG 15441]AUM63621.1 acetate kinase [Brevibacillus laterosporus]AYK06624.1 acetate kinase [Brevibacillus laterosporus]ERM16702.1 acetate kinase [Brevibacillus laterosporus PE36]
MAIVLSVNCGSSSLKYQLFDMPSERVLAKGLMERIGMEDSMSSFQVGDGEKLKETLDLKDHEVAVKKLIALLTDPEKGAIKDITELDGVGHRVVHGGETFKDSILVTDEVIKKLEELSELAPLHNPANIMGITAFQKILPSVPAVAVFDTAFHQTMPAKSYLYSIPTEYYEKYGIRKYGFHGTSHKYVMQRAAELLDRPVEKLRLISCHLGNGASLAAIYRGKSIDTSMGFTPLAGLPMGTRSGDIDVALLPYLQQKTGLSVDQLVDVLNKKSGLLAVSGLSSDLRDIESAAENNDERAELSLQIFVEKIRNYIGSYAMQMNGVDAIIFTAGIGENSDIIRGRVLDKLEWMGVYFDRSKNNVRGKETDLTFDHSPVKAFIIPTNEEVMIARDTMKFAKL